MYTAMIIINTGACMEIKINGGWGHGAWNMQLHWKIDMFAEGSCGHWGFEVNQVVGIVRHLSSVSE